MAFVFKKGLWRPTQVPNTPVEIDWQHPLARGLQFLCVPGYGFQDLTGRGVTTAVGGPIPSGSAIGRVKTFDGSSQYAYSRAPNVGYPFSLVGRLKASSLPSSSNANTAFSVCDITTGNINACWFDVWNNSGVTMWRTVGLQNGSTVYWEEHYTTSVPDTNEHCVVANFLGAAAHELFIDGVLQTVTAPGGGGAPTAPGYNAVTIGNLAWNNLASTLQYWPGSIGEFALYDHAISAVEARQHAAEPFAMLKAKISRQFYLVGAASSGIIGTASITEADDTVSGTGTIKIQAAASPTESNDTVAAAGTLKLQGAAANTEADDSSTATGTLKLQAAASITEVDDTSAATGALKIQAGASITEADDSLVATGSGTASTTGTADITEADDTVAATGTLKIQGAATITVAGDTAAATGALKVQGSASLTEADDTVASTGTVKLQAAAAITEGDDASVAAGALKIQGAATITEAGDTVSAAGYNPGAVILTPDPVFTVRVRVPRRSIVCPRRQVSISVPRRIARAL
jgi:hypothetical protein